jgi:predicted MFS family arabinose efflux permease
VTGDNLAALRHKPLAAYLAGNLVSNCGTWAQNIGLAVLAYRLTGGDTFWVGAMGFSQFAAVGLLAPWSGRLADRLPRRLVVLVASVVSAALGAVLAVLSALGALTLAVAVVVALLIGVATAFATPAMRALVTSLVPADEIGRAVTLESASYNVARVLGPVLGAAVVAGFGLTWAFAVNAASFLALVVGLHWAPDVGAPVRSPGASASFSSAVRLVARDPILVASFAVVVGISMASDAVTTLGPEVCTDILGRADTFAGVLVGAFGTGAVVAVLVTSPALRPTPGRLAGGCALMAVGLAGLAAASSTWVVLAALVVAGGGYLAANTEASTAILAGVADADRGRVSALWGIAFLGTRPVASLVLGTVASSFGVRWAAVAAVVPLLGALGALRWAAVTRRTATPAPA